MLKRNRFRHPLRWLQQRTVQVLFVLNFVALIIGFILNIIVAEKALIISLLTIIIIDLMAIIGGYLESINKKTSNLIKISELISKKVFDDSTQAVKFINRTEFDWTKEILKYKQLTP